MMKRGISQHNHNHNHIPLPDLALNPDAPAIPLLIPLHAVHIHGFNPAFKET